MSDAVHGRDDANRYDLDFANQSAIPEDGLPSASSPSQKRILAPDGSPVHEEFVRAAAEGQHTTRLKYLLAQGADIDAEGEAGLTALYNAAFRGDSENVQLLLASGADVNSRHEFAGTPICIAALRGHADVLEILSSHKANVVAPGGVMSSAIHCACFSGVVSIVKHVLSRGAKMDHHVVLQIDMLSKLAETSGTSAASQVLEANSSIHGSRSNHDSVVCSPILLLAHFGHFELLELCWTGYDTQRPCSPEDTWCFFNASETSTSSTWSFLGFPALLRRPPGRTLLMWAAASLDCDLVDYLLLAGAKVDAQDERGWSPLHYAASPFSDARFEALSACIQGLVDAGADVNMCT